MPVSASSPATQNRLTAARDATPVEGGYEAASDEPWLRLNIDDLRPSGKWIRLVYRASFLDPLTRPLLRLVSADGHAQDGFLPGPLHGRGVWIGFIPKNTAEILISPVSVPGLFGFDIEKCEIFARNRVLRRAFRGSREKTLAWLSAKMRGMDIEAMEEMTYALCHEPLANYQNWRRRRWRPFEIDGIDTPRFDWREGVHIRLAVPLRAGGRRDLAKLIARLEAQPYPNWSVAAVTAENDRRERAALKAAARGRLFFIEPDASVGEIARGLAPDALIGRCGERDEPAEITFAVLAEAARQQPDWSAVYGDEDRVDRRGLHSEPRLKPDWSPLFQATTNYLGAAVFARAEALSQSPATAALFADPDTPISEVYDIGREKTGHVRRILLSRATSDAAAPTGQSTSVVPVYRGGDPANPTPLATVVIPTRDRLDLLRACVESLAEGSCELIVVDNGSVEPATLAWLLEMESRPGIRVLRRPGRFNFSALCNDGAAMARSDILIFLNNDTVALKPDWLDPLVALAREPGVGAVGAKLLFPSGRVQHAGVVIGLVGRAGHVFWGHGSDDAGYLGAISAAREVSAVTAACLAVSREKFAAVGGFDAENLPIEVNDVDLCLRLREKGWVNIYTPECQLIHRESESRTRVSHHSKVYARERAYFTERWSGAMRDDPYFHPALSLFSTRPSLA